MLAVKKDSPNHRFIAGRVRVLVSSDSVVTDKEISSVLNLGGSLSNAYSPEMILQYGI